MDFTAIDFETANEQPDSACQLAAVVVRGGEVVDRRCWSIRPRPLRFRRSHIAIHGIRPADVADEPDFGNLWPEIAPYLMDGVLVAHNARFDLGVLLACLQTCRVAPPDLQYTCSCQVARRAWPGHGRYGLKPTAERLGIVFRHHDALEDSLACSQVMLAAARCLEVDSLEALERRLGLQRGRAGAAARGGPGGGWGRLNGRSAGGGRSTGGRRRGPPAEPRRSDTLAVDRLLGEVDRAGSELSGKTIVFTGHLQRLERQDALRLAMALGACCADRVTLATDLLVVGSPDQRTRAAGRRCSTKQQRAEQLQQEGLPIRILSEPQFLEMAGLPTTLALPAISTVAGTHHMPSAAASDAPGVPPGPWP